MLIDGRIECGSLGVADHLGPDVDHRTSTPLHLCQYTFHMEQDVVRVRGIGQAERTAPSRAMDACGVQEMRIDFGRGQVHLSAEQRAGIAAWRFDRSVAADKVDILLGGACRTARVCASQSSINVHT